jgi:pSer/pThr/pTyr-binding forkhead associated (FHA) protein
VYGFGYAFEAVAEDAAADETAEFGVCLLTWGTQQFRLRDGVHVVGRDSAADVALDAGTVSRRHARIAVHGGHATVEDLGSKNGTFVGEQRVTGVRPLRDGDEIRIGDYLLTFHAATLLPTETST